MEKMPNHKGDYNIFSLPFNFSIEFNQCILLKFVLHAANSHFSDKLKNALGKKKSKMGWLLYCAKWLKFITGGGLLFSVLLFM